VSDAESIIPLTGDIKILGMTLDKNLSMDKHVGIVCKASYYHLRSLRHIRRSLTDGMVKAVGCAIVDAMLDYANSVLQGISQYNIDRLQRVQNLLARIVTATPRHRPTVTSQELLIQLHWLPVKYRIQYKLAILYLTDHYHLLCHSNYLH
jgi:hypothetical protein